MALSAQMRWEKKKWYYSDVPVDCQEKGILNHERDWMPNEAVILGWGGS